MNKRNLNKLLSVSLIVLLNFFLVPVTSAASVTSLSDTLSTVRAATVSNHTVKFTTPTGVDSPTDTITVAFNSFTGTLVATDIALSTGVTTGLETSKTVAASAASGVWGFTFTAPNLVLTPPTNATTGEVTAGNKVVVAINNNKLTNPAVGTYFIDIAGNFGDTGRAAVAIITSDQIPVTASVDPSVTLTVANTTLELGVLTSGAVSTAGPNLVTLASNSSRGYTISVRDVGNSTLPGLYNAGSAYRIPSTGGAISAGTENYGGVCDVSGSPSGTCTYPTNASGNVGAFGVSSPTTLASLAAGSKPTGGGDQYSLRVRAAVATTTDPGSYSDTLTVVGTMNF